jgi:imidazoleglycerol-phosphate dehydratase/histidinol-phosphatase
MSAPTLFIDRDGTLVEEPPDAQVDSLDKIRFMPGVFPALLELTRRGFKLVMVTNQDGLGSRTYPEAAFRLCQDFILDALGSQGIRFEAVFVCPHWEKDGCQCRKPNTALVDQYLKDHRIDSKHSAVIGDRPTDLEFATRLGLPGFVVSRNGSPDQVWPRVLEALTARHASLTRTTRETHVDVRVNLDAEVALEIATGIPFFDHMLEQLARHGGFSLVLKTQGDLHIDEHHTVEDTALALGEVLRSALGDKRGITRYGFLLPMDEAEAVVCVDLSGRPFAEFTGRFGRDAVGAFPTELVPHFFRSLSEGLRAAIHVSVRGENTHHMIESCFKGVGRSLRQAFRLGGGTELPSTKGVL